MLDSLIAGNESTKKFVDKKKAIEGLLKDSDTAATLVRGFVESTVALSREFYDKTKQLFDTYQDVVTLLGATMVCGIDMVHMSEKMDFKDDSLTHLMMLGCHPDKVCARMVKAIAKAMED